MINNLNKFDWISSKRGKGRSEQTLPVKGREIPEDFIQNWDLLLEVNLQAVTERAFQVDPVSSRLE